MTATYTATVTATFPPQTKAVGDIPSGTITNIACGGPCVGALYSGAGTLLANFNNAEAFSMPVSYAFSGGRPSVTLQTPSSVTFTIVS
ncbi:hypothetical protein [Paraburkholderia caffeinilytica]|uniref:hypothetical protein n=1 Tax=Paraburkholderia caffeinilytica TaxID=1761016 RepID=UPI003D9FF866